MTHSTLRFHALLCGACAILLTACQDGTGLGTRRAPGVHIVRGSQADTAMAATELIAEVRGADREVLPGAVVEFRSLGPTDSAFVYLNPPGAITRRVVTDTTDARGMASTPVRLAYIAGTARLLVTVQSAGFQDTVAYLIRPGATAAIAISPADTAMYVDGSYPLTATATDQWGNARTDAVTFGTATPYIIAVSNDRVSGKLLGRGIVTARTGNVVDSAYVSVVPRGTLVLRGGGIWIMNLDGSGRRAIPRTGSPSNWGVPRQPLDWSPFGAELAFFGDGGTQQLWAGTPDGAVRPLAPPAPAGIIQRAPRFSRDGQWVYYNQGDPARYTTSLWRVRANGTGAERLTPDTPAFYRNDVDASGSPDSRKIVYGTDRERGWGISPPRRLVVMDLATRAVQDLRVLGNEPRWSPVADRIAYERNYRLWLINADGTGGRALTPELPLYESNLSWSPDGQWIAAERHGPFIDLIHVESGMILPLSFTAFHTDPAWRPGS